MPEDLVSRGQEEKRKAGGRHNRKFVDEKKLRIRASKGKSGELKRGKKRTVSTQWTSYENTF